MYKRIYCQCTRTISIFRSVRAKSFYDSLEISPHSTQAEIKEAYYKLSMVYHPDKNIGLEASQKFRDISEAYEVLRNVRLRKLYDKGLFLNPSIVHENDVNQFYKTRHNRSKPPPASGRTPIYDFDEWSKSHYGATLARDLERKKRRLDEVNEKIGEFEDFKKDKVFLCVFCLVLMTGYMFYGTEDFDRVADEITDQFSMHKR